jgi:hypothetical protein
LLSKILRLISSKNSACLAWSWTFSSAKPYLYSHLMSIISRSIFTFATKNVAIIFFMNWIKNTFRAQRCRPRSFVSFCLLPVRQFW